MRLRYPSAGSSRQYFGQSFKSLRHLNEEGGKGWVLNGGAYCERGLVCPVGGSASVVAYDVLRPPVPQAMRIVLQPAWDVADWSVNRGIWVNQPWGAFSDYIYIFSATGQISLVVGGVVLMAGVPYATWSAWWNDRERNHILYSRIAGSGYVWINGNLAGAGVNPGNVASYLRLGATDSAGSNPAPGTYIDWSCFQQSWTAADALQNAEIWGCR